MLRSQLSILGIYHWNSDVFDGLEVPEEMDKDITVKEILAQCSELELIYPSYDVMKELITSWSTIELPIWERVYKDCNVEYNPIWNVDGTETETITRELTGSANNSMTNHNTTIDSTKGYNSNNWTESDRSDSNGGGSSQGTNAESETITTEKTRGGNIGVTMTQQMLTADLDMLPRLNPYQYIVDSFRRRFCLLVY